MKRLHAIPAILLLVLLLSACGKSTSDATQAPKVSNAGSIDSSGHITLEFWYALGGSNGEAITALVDRFNSSQDQITVVPTYQGDYGAMMAKMWSALSAGTTPNVAQIGAAPLLGATGAIVPITDYTDGANGMDRSAILQAFWDYNSAGGQVWSMPFNQSVPVLYYNKDLFIAAGLDPEAPPATWDEVVEVGKQLTLDTDGNGAIDQWGFNTSDDTHWFLSTMMLSNGAEIINAEETEMLYNSPQAVAMLQFWSDMVTTHKIMPPNQHAEARGDFVAGKSAMFMASSSGIPGLEAETAFNLGVAQIPQAGAGRVAPIGGGSLIILKHANQTLQDAAWTFIKFMVSQESSLYLATHTGYLPLYTDALDWPELIDYMSANPNRMIPVLEMEYACAIPEFPALGTSDSELRKAVEAVELGTLTPQQALDQAKQAVDRNIREGGGN